MSTTTIRLPEELKAQIARLAERSGMTTHAFILDALAERVADDERRHEFHEVAQGRYAEIVASGETIPWSEMCAYLEARIAGREASRPKARRLGG
ncbi:MAG: ribbon-helix-helix protein, CopG family [Betaproteobacteria bacterium]|nr:ribbon-helix-helix protein, CopG family [Betaproteobacteria bacterium]